MIVSGIRDRKQLAQGILIIFYVIEIRFTGNIGTICHKIPGQLTRKSGFKTNQFLSTPDILDVIQIGQDFPVIIMIYMKLFTSHREIS